MSRGHGRIQRDIISALENMDRPVDTFDLAAEVYRLESNSANMIIPKERAAPARAGACKATSTGRALAQSSPKASYQN